MSDSAASSLFDLNGKSALITGATGALGYAAARALGDAGAHLTLAGGNEERLAEIAGEFSTAGIKVATVNERPSDSTSCDRIVAGAVAAGGGLDIVIPASGVAAVKPALEMELSVWDDVMDANVRQVWLLCRSAGKTMIDQGHGGKIILVSSVRGRFATSAGTSAYGPSKAAIDMLTRSLAMEWGRHGICVNAIAPTVFRSELTAWLFGNESRDKRAALLSRIPLGRLAEPEDHQGLLVFLASRGADFITGQVIYIDGGYSAN